MPCTAQRKVSGSVKDEASEAKNDESGPQISSQDLSEASIDCSKISGHVPL